MEPNLNHHGQDAFLQLLLELESRCLADAQLKQEHADAREAFLPQGKETLDAHAEHRFREWFLLERPSNKLGAPPAVFFAPEAPEPDSLWFRLLDSFLGIFKGIGSDDQGAPLLEDLWSGRQVRLAGTQMQLDENGVMVGRVAHGGGEQHVPLPGATFLVTPGLADAMASDLSRTRAAQPRARLSQLQCEDLLLPYHQEAHVDAKESRWASDLELLLRPHAEWDVDRVLDMVQELGIQEALSAIAFESDIDLEALRIIFQEMATEASTLTTEEESPQQSGSLVVEDETIHPDDVAAALAAFDAASTEGADLASRFHALEESLGLEPGTSDPFEDLATREPAPEERVGLEQPPGIPLCLATYLWELEQEQEHPKRETLEELSVFLEFLQDLQQETFEPERVLQHQLLAYLCRSRDLESLDHRIQHLDRFLVWLIQEQDAPLQWNSEVWEMVRQVVQCNAALASEEAPADAMALVDNLAPLTVAAEDGESARVLGWPAASGVDVQKGDALQGHWSDGKFTVRAWFPQALMPKQAAAQAE